MLYKPKNMYPRLNSDQPIIYLDQIPDKNEDGSDGTIDFTLNIDGDEKIQNIRGNLYYGSLEDVSPISGFNVNISKLSDYGMGSANGLFATNPEENSSTPFVLNATYDYSNRFSPNKKLTYDDRAKLGDTDWTSTSDRNGFFWETGQIIQYYMAGYYVTNEGFYSVYDPNNSSPKIGDIDADLYMKTFFDIPLLETQKNLFKFGKWGLRVNDDYGIVSRDVDSYKPYISMEIKNNRQIDIDVSNSFIIVPEAQWTVGQPFCEFTVSTQDLLLGYMQISWDKAGLKDCFKDTNDTQHPHYYGDTKIICTVNAINKTDKILEITCKCNVKSLNFNSTTKIDFTEALSPIVICGNISTMAFTFEKTVNQNSYKMTSVSIAPQGLSIGAFLNGTPMTDARKSYMSMKWDGIQENANNPPITLSSLNLYPVFKDNLSITSLPNQNLNIYPKDNLQIKYKIPKNMLPKNEDTGTFVINPQITCQYNYFINNSLYFLGERFKIQTSGIPQIDINILQQVNHIHTIGKFTPTSLQEKIKNYQWKLHKGTIQNNQINGQLIYQTPKIYSQDFQFEYDNLIPGNYVIEAIVEDNYGQIWSKRENFIVSYEENDLYLNFQNELDKENTGVKLKWDKPNLGIALADSSLYQFDEEIQIKNQNNETIDTWENCLTRKEFYHPSQDTDYDAFTDPNGIGIMLNEIPEQYRYITWKGKICAKKNIDDYMFLSVRSLGVDGSIWYNSFSLYGSLWTHFLYYDSTFRTPGPSIELPSYSYQKYSENGPIKEWYKEMDEDTYLIFEWDRQNKTMTVETYFYNAGRSVDGDYYDSKQEIKFAEENLEKYPDYMKLGKINHFNLNGFTSLDFFSIGTQSFFKKNEDGQIERNKNFSTEWNPIEFFCLLSFNNKNFSYKDPYATVEFNGYSMKRYNSLTQKVLDMGQYYFTKENTEEERRFIDYSLSHNEEVKYLIYPQGTKTTIDEESDEISQKLVFSPVYSDLIKGDWDKWCLFTTRGPVPKNLDGSDTNGYNENVLLVDKVFFFEMNVETGSIKNNTDFSVVKNFTLYPQVQRSPSNYWSGQLKGLLGRLAIDDCTFKQTPTMLQEIKDLTQNTSRKFLKDRDGNFWEIELSSDITVDNNDTLDVQLKTKSFNWVEVGDASNTALVSVGPSREDWLLTELGYEKIDTHHIWDDSAIWDDNNFWTESE